MNDIIQIIKEALTFLGKKLDAIAGEISKTKPDTFQIDLTETNKVLKNIADKQNEPINVSVEIKLK